MKRLNYLVILGTLAALILAMVAIVPASADTSEHTRTVNTVDGSAQLCGVRMDI